MGHAVASSAHVMFKNKVWIWNRSSNYIFIWTIQPWTLWLNYVILSDNETTDVNTAIAFRCSAFMLFRNNIFTPFNCKWGCQVLTRDGGPLVELHGASLPLTWRNLSQTMPIYSTSSAKDWPRAVDRAYVRKKLLMTLLTDWGSPSWPVTRI